MITEDNDNIAITTLSKIESTYWRKKFLEKLTWYEPSKLPKIADIPFADKKIDNKNTEESNPPLGLSRISSKTWVKNVCVSVGKKSSR